MAEEGKLIERRGHAGSEEREREKEGPKGRRGRREMEERNHLRVPGSFQAAKVKPFFPSPPARCTSPELASPGNAQEGEGGDGGSGPGGVGGGGNRYQKEGKELQKERRGAEIGMSPGREAIFRRRWRRRKSPPTSSLPPPSARASGDGGSLSLSLSLAAVFLVDNIPSEPIERGRGSLFLPLPPSAS
jgi:hypothetical protein